MRFLSLSLFMCVALCFMSCAPSKNKTPAVHDVNNVSSGVEKNFNNGWLFLLDDQVQFSQTGFDDNTWRKLSVPHDWSVEHDFTQEQADGATGYLPGGIGWYRKHFVTPHTGTQQFIYFDGIYNHAQIWVNGKKIAQHVNGYTPIYLDVTAYLAAKGMDNVIAVRVDHSRYIDSRWYTGSGIYRDVKFISTQDVYIPLAGSFITTPVITKQFAQVDVQLELINASRSPQEFELTTHIVDAQGRSVAQFSETKTLAATSHAVAHQTLTLKSPILWEMAAPYSYQAVTKISQGAQVVDQYKTSFGVRELRFDAQQGFFLNGQSVKIKGVNLHHDAGLVGSAVPDDVWRRRLATLKEAGVNAIRIAHNPSSAAFLDICDEMGLLVQAEIFDEWDNPKDKRLNQQERHSDFISRGYADYFQTHAHDDLLATVKRDRNHPSLIMWSIGNEIEWTYPKYPAATGYFDMSTDGNYFFTLPPISSAQTAQRLKNSPKEKYELADTAKKLSAWVKALDTSRPVTANLILPSVSHVSGYTDALDVIGYSYRRVEYDTNHQLFPDKMILGAENVPQWHEWQAVAQRDFVAGTFLWTGIDYLGEVHDQWPTKALRSGLLDTAGFKKTSFHFFKTLWDSSPHVYLSTQTLEKSPYTLNDQGLVIEKKPDAWKTYLWIWHEVNHHWNYSPKQMIAIEVYSNCAQVELWANKKSLGVKSLVDFPDRIYKWALPFKVGELVARGLGECRAQDQLITAGAANAIDLRSDKKILLADAKSVAHIDVQLLDAQANPVVLDNREITFTVTGPANILGVDNGAHDSVQRFQANHIVTAKGRALLILQAQEQTGIINIQASGNDIPSVNLEINVVAP